MSIVNEVHAAQVIEQLRVAAVGARGGETPEQFRRFLEQHSLAIAAGLLDESPRQPGFADAGRPDQKQVLVFAHPG